MGLGLTFKQFLKTERSAIVDSWREEAPDTWDVYARWSEDDAGCDLSHFIDQCSDKDKVDFNQVDFVQNIHSWLYQIETIEDEAKRFRLIKQALATRSL